jgi:hypothetical protein
LLVLGDAPPRTLETWSFEDGALVDHCRVSGPGGDAIYGAGLGADYVEQPSTLAPDGRADPSFCP